MTGPARAVRAVAELGTVYEKPSCSVLPLCDALAGADSDVMEGQAAGEPAPLPPGAWRVGLAGSLYCCGGELKSRIPK